MPELLGADGFAPVADAALELTGVDGVEVLFMHEWGGLTQVRQERDPPEHEPRGHRPAGPRGVEGSRRRGGNERVHA